MIYFGNTFRYKPVLKVSNPSKSNHHLLIAIAIQKGTVTQSENSHDISIFEISNSAKPVHRAIMFLIVPDNLHHRYFVNKKSGWSKISWICDRASFFNIIDNSGPGTPLSSKIYLKLIFFPPVFQITKKSIIRMNKCLMNTQ